MSTIGSIHSVNLPCILSEQGDGNFEEHLPAGPATPSLSESPTSTPTVPIAEFPAEIDTEQRRTIFIS